MGNLIGGLKPSFRPDQEVEGTGQSVGDLRGAGYSDDELKTLGAKKTPGPLMSGLATGLAQGLQKRDEDKAAIARSGRPVYSDLESPTLPADFFASPDYLNQARMRFGPAFYGRY